MSSLAHIAVHHSQFPEQVRRDLLESLRTRQVNHKFHYDSVKQTQKWLALHAAYSPSRTDSDCAAIYDQGFAAAAARVPRGLVHLLGLGCGGGQKDTRLLKLLQESGREVSYTPCDVSAAMVLVARQAALSVVRPENCFPLVCDLAWAGGPEAVDVGQAFQPAGQRGFQAPRSGGSKAARTGRQECLPCALASVRTWLKKMRRSVQNENVQFEISA